jgi:hypothetical protein
MPHERLQARQQDPQETHGLRRPKPHIRRAEETSSTYQSRCEEREEAMTIFEIIMGAIICTAWAFLAREVWKRDTPNRRNIETRWEEFSPG